MRPDPPRGLAVVDRHDGVDVHFPRAAAVPKAVVVGVATTAILGLALAAPRAYAGWVIAAAVPVMAVLQVLMSRRAWRLDINERWVEVETIGLRSSTRTRFPLDELKRWWIGEPREDYSGHYLVLQGRDGTLGIAEGVDVEHLRYVVALIDEAVETRRRREAVEGKEWGFQKKAPEAIKSLVERS